MVSRGDGNSLLADQPIHLFKNAERDLSSTYKYNDLNPHNNIIIGCGSVGPSNDKYTGYI